MTLFRRKKTDCQEMVTRGKGMFQRDEPCGRRVVKDGLCQRHLDAKERQILEDVERRKKYGNYLKVDLWGKYRDAQHRRRDDSLDADGGSSSTQHEKQGEEGQAS